MPESDGLSPPPLPLPRLSPPPLDEESPPLEKPPRPAEPSSPPRVPRVAFVLKPPKPVPSSYLGLSPNGLSPDGLSPLGAVVFFGSPIPDLVNIGAPVSVVGFFIPDLPKTGGPDALGSSFLSILVSSLATFWGRATLLRKPNPISSLIGTPSSLLGRLSTYSYTTGFSWPNADLVKNPSSDGLPMASLGLSGIPASLSFTLTASSFSRRFIAANSLACLI